MGSPLEQHRPRHGYDSFMPRARPHVRKWARLVLAAASCLAALLIAEVGLRILDLPRVSFEFLGTLESDVYREDPELFWRLDPDTQAYRPNRLGLRGWLPDLEKGPRDFRIVCVGDSSTFGSGVRYEETYGMRLERMLQDVASGVQVEVMLAALPGYSTQQSSLLFQKHVAPRKPDVTVLYCGAWNDFVPALGLSDAERMQRGSGMWSRSHLGRLVGQLLGPTDADREGYVRAFGEGRAPDGRRVPLDVFETNIRGLIQQARAVGSWVEVVLPPLPESTRHLYPIAQDYHRVVRRVAEEEGIAVLDAGQLFEDLESRCPEEWRIPAVGKSLCCQDWLHPSALGHELLARSLFERIEPLVAGWARDVQSQRESELAVDSCAPEQVPALQAREIVIHGRGFSGAGAFDRVWVGDSWIDRVEVIDDHRLRLEVPVNLPPGRHWITIDTGEETVRGTRPLVVEPVRLEASLFVGEKGLELKLAGRGPAGWRLGWWLSLERRPTPADTLYGPFHLAATPDGTTPGVSEAPFRFDKLRLLGQMDERLDGQGTWSMQMQLPARGERPARVFVQGLVVDPQQLSKGAVTEVLTLEVPR